MALPFLAATGAGLASEAGLALAGEAGKAIASAVDPAARAYRQQLKKDITELQRGKLGLSEAEKRSMLAGAQRGLQAQTAAAEANLRRSAAAQGGFGRSGAQQQALGAIAAGRSGDLASYAGKVDELSQAKAQQRFADIMGRIEAKRDEARKTGAMVAGGALGVTARAVKAYPQMQAKWMEEQLGTVEPGQKTKKEATETAASGVVVK